MTLINKSAAIAVAAVLAIGSLGVGVGKLTSNNSNSENVLQIINTSSSPNQERNSAATPPSSESAPVASVKTNKKNVLILNEVVDSMSVDPIINQLKALDGSKDRILLLIDSPGGSVLDGGRLITQMESMKTPVDTVCIGLCASMGAMIHSYGNHRFITNRSILMYHPASGGFQGQLQNVQSRLNLFSSYVKKLEENVQKRSGLSKEYYDSRIAYEFWADSDEAKRLNLVEGVVSLNVAIPSKNLASAEERIKKYMETTSKTEFTWIFTGFIK